MINPKPGKLTGKESIYKVLNKFLDRKIQHDKGKIVEKYFDVNSQENLLKKFMTIKERIVSPGKK